MCLISSRTDATESDSPVVQMCTMMHQDRLEVEGLSSPVLEMLQEEDYRARLQLFTHRPVLTAQEDDCVCVEHIQHKYFSLAADTAAETL